MSYFQLTRIQIIKMQQDTSMQTWNWHTPQLAQNSSSADSSSHSWQAIHPWYSDVLNGIQWFVLVLNDIKRYPSHHDEILISCHIPSYTNKWPRPGSRSGSATKRAESATMSRQPKRAESATKSAESGTMSRQLRKRWFGNQKTNIVGN